MYSVNDSTLQTTQPIHLEQPRKGASFRGAFAFLKEIFTKIGNLWGSLTTRPPKEAVTVWSQPQNYNRINREPEGGSNFCGSCDCMN